MTKKRRTYRVSGEAKESVIEFRESLKTMTSEELYAQSTRVAALKTELRARLGQACLMGDLVRDAILA